MTILVHVDCPTCGDYVRGSAPLGSADGSTALALFIARTIATARGWAVNASPDRAGGPSTGAVCPRCLACWSTATVYQEMPL